MTWSEIVANPEPVMPMLMRRFPDLRRCDVTQAQNVDVLAERLARRHDLTPREAHEQIDDALFVADLRNARRR